MAHPLKFSAWQKVTGYFLVIIGAAWLASRILVLDSIFFYFGIALLLSYLLLRSEGRTLLSLGIKPEGRRDWQDFFWGIVIGIMALLISAGVTIWLNGSRLEFTGRIDPVFLLILILIHLWSSFAQEFTYRGYPFQRLLRAYGPWVAQLVITLPFAVMHLKLNTTITIEQFLMTWLTTGLGSILYGLCYLKTGKLILPIGLHMGWNLAQALVPRSPEENKTMLFQLIQPGGHYQPLNVLWPYLGVTLLLMSLIWRYPKRVRI
ncbi:CPBP family intramembrane glutamic endopeptidase [Mucilaginibacter segetis]|uniref:CPBP family intramembrane metalloprotease n=1 Tax=Mucilaginibacter segetis TaxID=2793071 RepID=A0A934PTC0_9SPHI|nr:type II CAAX endopeptidase family protein [Mucilaginibacter segetis]MBK0379217.1 CPBP family intramembrane metalloprotease [Mucilaginibacter segetis]